MSGREGDLEVLVPVGDGEGADPSEAPPASGSSLGGRWRRWPVVAVAVVLAAGAVGLPLRERVARGELSWLERQWAESVADDGAQVAAAQSLTAYLAVSNGPADVAIVNAGLAGVYGEEQQRFDALRVRLHRAVLVDSRVVAVRAAMVVALAQRSDLLGEVAVWYRHPRGSAAPPATDNRSDAEALRVEQDIAAARVHWGERKAAPEAAVAAYPGATAALARLSHWLDQRSGAVLVAQSGDQLVRLDVDASQTIATGVHLNILDARSIMAMRQGYLAYISGGQAWAVAPDGSGKARDLAPAYTLFPAADPTAIWVVNATTTAATEIDGTGRVIMGPLRPPGLPIAATAGALIESLPSSQPLLEVWGLADQRVDCRLTGTGTFGPEGTELATSGNLVAWVDGANLVHVTDATSCADTFELRLPLDGQQPQGTLAAAFSPDGLALAVASGQSVSQADAFPLTLLDLKSGQATTIPTAPGDPEESIAWTADGTRVFWLYDPIDTPTIVATWKVGDQQSHILRAPNLGLVPPLLAVS